VHFEIDRRHALVVEIGFAPESFARGLRSRVFLLFELRFEAADLLIERFTGNRRLRRALLPLALRTRGCG